MRGELVVLLHKFMTRLTGIHLTTTKPMKKQLLLLSSLFAVNCMYAAVTQLPQQKVEQVSQDDVKVHRVAMGETMTMIAKKYMVLPQDIYDINPGSADGLSAGMTLKIPVGKKVKVETEQKNLDYQLVDASEIVKQKERKQQQEIYPVETKAKKAPIVQETVAQAQPVIQPEADIQNESHEVKPGETLSGLASKYNTTISAITAANPKALKRGLQAGQKLIMPSPSVAEGTSTENIAVASAATIITEVKQEFTGTHHVKPGETLHSLARKYNTSVEAITSANEKLLKRGLQAGQTLVVPASGATTAENTAVASAETVVVPNHVTYSEEPTGTTEHKVESGETLHGLARKYNTSIEAITAANKQKLKRGLQAGQLLKIPVAMTSLASHVNQQ